MCRVHARPDYRLREHRVDYRGAQLSATLPATADYGRAYGFDQIEKLAEYQKQVPMSDNKVYQPLIDLQTNIGESNILTIEPTRHYLVNAKQQWVPCTESHLRPYMEAFATTLKGHHNLLVALVSPLGKQTNDACTVETLESVMTKIYMWHYHYARGKCRADFSMPNDLFFKTSPQDAVHAISYYALLDRDIDQIVALNTGRIADMFDYITTHRNKLVAELRQTDAQRASEVERAFDSEQALAKVLWLTTATSSRPSLRAVSTSICRWKNPMRKPFSPLIRSQECLIS